MSPPLATYRLQLHAGFDLDAAAAVVPYLATLGVSHVYTSPILQAAAGSTHGYDVVDHGRISDELGGAVAFDRLVAAARGAGLGLVVDIVPNHMAIGPANAWWWDVLKHGPASRFAGYFDVDWDPPEGRLRNLILLPVLADHYGRVLEAGDLRLDRREGDLVVTYGDHSFPLDPDSLGPELAAASDDAIASVNADADRLDALLQVQNYRLAFWRASSRDLGYRRFFDIDTRVGLRVEDP
ncbi:MAG TPA: alpha-amylase family glycosyl hydrolase [Candidatus Limnocylindrales bacterium]|nr:alpha-amylase family glycosyl hydrolase [Candidatus Limnocylindrales bacterium]